MSTQQMTPDWLRALLAVIEREFQTVVRTRALVALGIGFIGLVFGLAWTSGAVGYLPLILDLLTPIELLVPVLVFGFAYRSILDDRSRGELDIIRTYPLSDRTYVAGVYLGRSIGILIVVLSSLLVAVGLVPLFGGASSTVIASHTGMDSLVLYLRFVVLTGLFALVVLAVAVAISAIATTARSAIGLTVVLLLVLLVGIDLGIIAGLAANVVPESTVEWLIAASPSAAYRGLVLELAVSSQLAESASAANPAANVIGFLTWWGFMIVVAIKSL